MSALAVRRMTVDAGNTARDGSDPRRQRAYVTGGTWAYAAPARTSEINGSWSLFASA